MAKILQGGQLILYPNRTFKFRKLPIDSSALIQGFNNNDSDKRAWDQNHKLEKRCEGYRNIPSGMYMLSHYRDCLYDPLNQLSQSEKPEKGPQLIKDFVTKKAEAKCYKHEHEAKQTLTVERFTLTLCIVAVILGLCIGLQVAL